MIKVDIGKCTGCRMCETACSFYRSGAVNRHTARIKVVNLYQSGVDGPVVCVQCKERYCKDCPADAISIGSLGQVIVSPTLCTLCKKCERSCPIGAIEIFNDLAYVCDLCGGSPKCVEACTEGAITYVPEQIEVISLKEIKKETKKVNSSEKRAFTIKSFCGGVQGGQFFQKAPPLAAGGLGV
jgi:carbon-monoxide dehydrogenase iron sulfur subunit